MRLLVSAGRKRGGIEFSLSKKFSFICPPNPKRLTTGIKNHYFLSRIIFTIVFIQETCNEESAAPEDICAAPVSKSSR